VAAPFRLAWYAGTKVENHLLDALDLAALLDRVEKEMPKALPEVQ
jgi:hypothetical protein